METFIGQLLALITFFAFPAIQYLILKKTLRKSGRPELWYLPSYGFRLVIRNMPYKKHLSDVKNKSYIRKRIEPNTGSSVATLEDIILVERESMFLISGLDHILISFKVVGENESSLKFVQTDKMGNSIKEVPLADFGTLVSDYTANIENFLNFDIKIAKRVTIELKSLENYWLSLKTSNRERIFKVDKIIDVG